MFFKMIIAIAMFFVIVPSVQAASPQDVQKVIRLVQSGNSKGILLRKKNKESHSTQIVFVFQGKRYTIAYFPKNDSNELSTQALAYWIRQDGTTSQVGVITFTDEDRMGLDGVVDFGVGPHVDENTFIALPNGPGKVTGIQFRPLWQKKYDQAIDDTLHFFQQQP